MVKEKDNTKTIEVIKEEIKAEKKDRFEAVEVTTQTSTVIRDNKTNEFLKDQDLLLLILNKLDRIEKNIAG